MIDFGRELYTPWQLVQGKVLYRDVASFYGPLSPYVNALWFTIFGISLRTLALCNMAIMIGLIAMLHRLISGIADRFAAAVACLVFVLLFGFAQLVQVGNYNYVCPYSHEATHGLAMSIAALLCLMEFSRSGKAYWAWAMGGLLGLVF